jgi:hypothetical protein
MPHVSYLTLSLKQQLVYVALSLGSMYGVTLEVSNCLSHLCSILRK